MIEQNLDLARKLVSKLKRRLPRRVQREDLESDAYLGLVQAARSFDASRGSIFRAFASTRINGAMLDGIRQRNQIRRHQGQT